MRYIASQRVRKKESRPQGIRKRTAVRNEGSHLQDSTLLLEAGPGLFCPLRTLPQVLCLHAEFGLRQLQMFLREDSSDVKNLKSSHTTGPRGSVPGLEG